jgi:hypothetical protein
VRLHRQPTPPAGVTYAVTSYWEERFGDRTRRDGLAHTLTVHAQAEATGWGCAATPRPRLFAPARPSALEQVLEKLAGSTSAWCWA